MPELTQAALEVLNTADAGAKADASRAAARWWHDSPGAPVGNAAALERPARSERPPLKPPREMPRRRYSGKRGRIALLHAVAHIELNAIDLAWDLVARFPDTDWPRDFYSDWVRVGDDEARHFTMLRERLQELGADYGDLPAHDGLWEAAHSTRHDPLARLAIVPMVFEARGLDVTPGMISRLERAGDEDSCRLLRLILQEEISHVAAGRRWFEWLCERRGLDPVATWRELVHSSYSSVIKPPFNQTARDEAGIRKAYYAN